MTSQYLEMLMRRERKSALDSLVHFLRSALVTLVVLAFVGISATGCGDEGSSHGSNTAGVGGDPLPVGERCQSSSAIALLVQSNDVVAYVPKGSWYLQQTGIVRVHLEGPNDFPATSIDTPQVVNSCAANSANGHTICISNQTDVYELAGPTLRNTLLSAGSGYARFSTGVCTDCSVVFDQTHDQATIGLMVGNRAAYQPVAYNSGTPQMLPATISPAGRLGESMAFDSERNLLLSPDEGDVFEIAEWPPSGVPSFFEDQAGTVGVDEIDGVAEDCTTGVAVATDEATGQLFLTNLAQSTFTSGAPSGSWSAPSQLQDLPGFSDTIERMGGIAIAPGSHFGTVAGEIAGNTLGAFQLPAAPGSSDPTVADWVSCGIPDDPSGTPWAMGLDPHPLSAYVSPATGHAMAVVANSPPTYLAVVDITAMINAAALPRTAGRHTCDAGMLPSSLVRFVPLS
ncbi:MAG TPA: hypothetical protein VMT61_10170 [Candidatus Binataceae bacterium]|nr:hypothetical protein [Candidatus Binataceae bacterium]